MLATAKNLIVVALLFAAASCSSSAVDENFDTIEVHRSGDLAYNIVVHANGTGEFQGNELLPEKGQAAFNFRPEVFRQIASVIQPYERCAVTFTEKGLGDIVLGSWPTCEGSRSLDAGALYVRWQGPRKNAHYLIDFGCNEHRHPDRSRELLEAIHRLPIQEFIGNRR